MFTRFFRYKEFASPTELTAFFEKNNDCDVVTVQELNGKWMAFYYERVWYTDAPVKDQVEEWEEWMY